MKLSRAWISFPVAIGLIATVVFSARVSGAVEYQDRFVWLFGWGLGRDADVAAISNVVESAAGHGINGAVLSAGLDTLCKKSSEYFERLEAVRRLCEERDVELIPSLFSVGYGGAVLAHNPNLAAGIPVVDAPFEVKGERAEFVPLSTVEIENGGLEDYEGNRFSAFDFHDQPGEVSFADTNIFREGRASMRLENFTANPYGHGRVMQEVTVTPHRCYRVELWVKTQGLTPLSGFKTLVLADGRNLAPRTFDIERTAGWRRLAFVFNSLEFDKVKLYAGMWQGRSGKLWVDDWSIEEIGPVNVLHRPGTPVTVKSADGSVVYEEGRDYATLTDTRFRLYAPDHEPAVLRILRDGRIEDGDRLRVSWYHPMIIHDSQITICMAEPEVYEIWEREAELLSRYLEPKRILLNMDEIRMGGTCKSCGDMDMSELLGECITRQTQILKRHFPDVQIYIWSDMLDPNHNAHGDYYLVDGDFAGSWNHVPEGLTIAVWGGEPRRASLDFFDKEGFDVMIACYYDADDLEGVRAWMEEARDYDNIRGFMYTPWRKKYELLPAFGDLLREK